MEKTDNQRVQEAVLEVIRKQIQDNEPPETKQTLIRLLEKGFSEKDALKLIGYVVTSEVFSVLQENRKFDRDKYITALNSLPKLPWEKEA